MPDLADLELSPDAMRAMIAAVSERVVAHVATLAGSAGVRGRGGHEDLCRAMREPAPELGAALDPLLDPLFEQWIPRSFTTPRPGYLAYIPGGGLFPAALADFIATATNRYTGVWQAAPALVQLEANVLEWFRDWMGFPATDPRAAARPAARWRTSTRSCARASGTWAADIRRGVLYTSTQVHHSVVKSAKLAGILPGPRPRASPWTREFRMRVDALEAAIARTARRAAARSSSCRPRARRTPAPSIRSTRSPTCARREGLWHHVDGAYGAFFHLCRSCDRCWPGSRGRTR